MILKKIGKFFGGLLSKIKSFRKKIKNVVGKLRKNVDVIEELLNEGNIEKVREKISDIKSSLDFIDTIL